MDLLNFTDSLSSHPLTRRIAEATYEVLTEECSESISGGGITPETSLRSLGVATFWGVEFDFLVTLILEKCNLEITYCPEQPLPANTVRDLVEGVAIVADPTATLLHPVGTARISYDRLLRPLDD